MTFEELLGIPPYSLGQDEKERLLSERLLGLTELHRERCPEYGRILDAIGFDGADAKGYSDIPFLPVRLFKELSLKSVPDGEVVKTMTSSGTTGQQVSKIYLDKETSLNQQKAMVKIVSDFTGTGRMPMVIIDCPSVVKDRAMFSARGAGILGFSMFGSKRMYALDDDMRLDVRGLQEFLEKYKGQRILLFGFTFMVWQHFYKELMRIKGEGVTFDLSDGILIHGGGWKKLASEAVSREEFHARLKDTCGLERIHDYYGMVEQTGCIYMECECGHLHASVFSDVITRNPFDFSECAVGERGILQVVSTIPESYPGHSLLTEDEGVVLGVDDCPCGRKGKYFKVLGRLKDAEIRGCSDTYADKYGRGIGVPQKQATGFAFAEQPGEPQDEPYVKDVMVDNRRGSLDSIDSLIGDADVVLGMPSLSPLPPFADAVMDFLQDVSKEIMGSKGARDFPDVVTLGFWLRKGNLVKMRESVERGDTQTGFVRVGRGVAFHVAPSNVPVNYAYSLFTGLLCGNANVVKVPSRDFPQVSLINRAIATALERHEGMRPYLSLVRYGHDRAVNDILSSLCDVRVIWGGDVTVGEIRKSDLRPRATEITFADRYSLAVIDSDRYLGLIRRECGDSVGSCDRGQTAVGLGMDGTAAARIAFDFYNDTYLTDQNACTSPRVVVWTGNSIEEAKEIFWEELHKVALERYQFQPIQGVDKLSVEYVAAASGVTEIHETRTADNLLVRVQIRDAVSSLMEHRGNSGYFYEYDYKDILEIRDLCNDVKCQTIGLLGDVDIVKPLFASGIKGVDRVVPIGHTMDFGLVWDGYDLVERMTRKVEL